MTTQFLGVQSQCISCHNGAHHLEPINLYLSVRKREEFWRQSAFFSRTSSTRSRSRSQFQPDAFCRISIARTAAIHVQCRSEQSWSPPARTGGPYSAQRILLTGETPGPATGVRELARIDHLRQQFARATRELHLGALLQVRHRGSAGRLGPGARRSEAIRRRRRGRCRPRIQNCWNALADEFIQSNYSIRHIIE